MRFRSALLAASIAVLVMANFACAAPFAFVPSGSFYDVAVVDTATNAAVATIHGPGNGDGVAVNPDGLHAYFTSNYAYNNVVWVLDTTTYAVVASIQVGSFPTGIALDSSGSRVFVANTNSNSISVIDTSSNSVVATHPACSKPWGIAVHPAGTRLYVGCWDPDGATASIDVRATSDGGLIARVALGAASSSPLGIAVHPSGRRVFVTSNALVAIDTASNSIANVVAVGSRPGGVALDASGARAYVANAGSGTITVVDTEASVPISTLAVGGEPGGVSVRPDGRYVYVANQQYNNVAVIDAASSALVTTIPVGGAPLAIGQFIGGASPPPPAAPVPGPAQQVAAGAHHTCAVLAKGGVKCWGWNLHGQLGDGTVTDRSAPADVRGLSEPVVAVATGDAHTCALSSSGGVKCWGWNSYGQLGDGSAGNYDWYSHSTVARDVVGLTSGVLAIAAGADHSCALTSTGSVLCWGGNGSGQLGDGTGDSRGTPKAVKGLPLAIAGIAAGTGVSAAITSEGQLKYWGRERVDATCPGGSVCLPVNSITLVPKDAPALPGPVTAVSLTDPFFGDTCVLIRGGRVMCWGGLPWHPASDIGGLLPGATAIAAGCALVNDGTAQCWTAANNYQAATVAGLPSGMTGIAAGGARNALTAEGKVMCWGTNQYGEVGGGNTLSRPSPVVVVTTAVIPVPVVEFYHAALDHYFITWMPDEIAILDAGVQIRGWTRTGQVFNAYTILLADVSPVCRFYIPPALGDSHFFGRGSVECAATWKKNPTFILEDASFMKLFLPAAGVCPPNTREVYRVFSNRPDANHRYMTDKGIRDQMVAKGWLAEGDGPNLVVMCAPA